MFLWTMLLYSLLTVAPWVEKVLSIVIWFRFVELGDLFQIES